MPSATSLPTPRQLLTSTLDALAEIPPPALDTGDTGDALQQQEQQQARAATSGSAVRDGAGTLQPPPLSSSSNPLRHLDQARRHLFATLHVLFPSLLLPALDLLDRTLVTRLLPLPPVRHAAAQQAAPPSRCRPQPPSVYVVRSAQKKPFRRGVSSGGDAVSGQGVYLVHTAAWSCSCAAFAFSAFSPVAGHSFHQLQAVPSRPSSLPAVREVDGAEVDAGGRPGDGRSNGWGFGGLSLDGMNDDGGMPPCCKHLLACVLAETCHGLLGRYVNVRMVGREEMAGIFADV